MKRRSTLFLQLVIVLFGIVVLAAMLWEPHLEGRNAQATLFEIYFNDPFLAYVYIGSVPFYVALYQAFNLMGYVGLNKAFSPEAVKALQKINYCAKAIVGFVAVALIIIMMNNSDDRAGGVFMCLLITFGSIVLANVATVFERIFQSGLDIKSQVEQQMS